MKYYYCLDIRAKNVCLKLINAQKEVGNYVPAQFNVDNIKLIDSGHVEVHISALPRDLMDELGFSDAELDISLYCPEKEQIDPYLQLYVTKVITDDISFALKLEGSASKLQKEATSCYSKSCRANFGDAKCGFDISAIAEEMDITIESSNKVKLHGSIESVLKGGVMILHGERYFITSYEQNIATLSSAIPKEVWESKKALFAIGCDKSFSSCCNKFNNGINFRGEPFVVSYKELQAI